MTSAANSLPTACPAWQWRKRRSSGLFGGEPAVLGLCGRCPYGADEGGLPRVKIMSPMMPTGRRSRRAIWPALTCPIPPPPGVRLGPQLAEVLPAPWRWGEKLHCPEWEQDTRTFRRRHPAADESGLTFGTRVPCLYPAVLWRGLEACTRKGDRVLDLGVRQRHPSHCRPVPGSRSGGQGGH